MWKRAGALLRRSVRLVWLRQVFLPVQLVMLILGWKEILASSWDEWAGGQDKQDPNAEDNQIVQIARITQKMHKIEDYALLHLHRSS